MSAREKIRARALERIDRLDEGDLAAIHRLREHYVAMAHGVQSAVAHDIAVGGMEQAGATPKHLRAGVNMALVETSALVDILVRKGLITDLEWVEALAEFTEAEVERYEAIWQKKTGHSGLNFR